MARLTIPDEQTFATFTVVTSTSAFPITFSLFAKADLTVLVDDVALEQSDFTFAGTLLEGGGYDGGTVTLNTAVDDVTVRIERNVTPARTSNFAPASTTPVQSVDQALNRQMAISQDHVRRIGVAETTLEGVAGNVAAVAADRAAIEAIFDVAGEVQSGASVTFLAAGTGAVVRDLQARLRDTVSVFDFIPVAEHAAITAGTSTYNASAAVQAAIDTGKTVEFPEGAYQVVGLTMSTNNQRLVALGNVNLQKRANGVILSSSADNIELNGITFRGESATPAFTGDNISLTGNAPRIINCGSLWAFGRALKATGNTVVIHGSNPIWQTTDATSNGFDIEIGVSGTATLYHHLQDVYTSQATGGILMTDTGSHAIVGGQFGKYSVLSGTSPAGSNAGTTVSARIIGTVQIGLANGLFSGCAFSSITLTCLVGTSGISIDRSNAFAVGATVVNNGNASNVIQLDGGVGGYQSTKFGGTSSVAVQAWDPDSGNMLMPAGDILINGTNKGVKMTSGGHAILPSGNNLALVNSLGSTQVIPAGTLQLGGTDTNSLDVNAIGPVIRSAYTPASAGATGTTGQVAWDTGYIYVCTATNTWKRVAIATW
jgi:hypothetical protein